MADKSLIPIIIAEQSATPTNPPSGYQKVYPKSDGNMYALNSSGVEKEITNVVGGGLSFGEIMRLNYIFG